MAKNPSISNASNRWILLLLLLAFGMAVGTWDDFRQILDASSRVITQPVLRQLGWMETNQPLKDGGSAQLAETARSIRFRLQNYRVDSVTLQGWMEEWKNDPVRKLLVLHFILEQLPEAWSRDTPDLQRQDLLKTILELVESCRQSDPDNAFPSMAGALAHFYADHEKESLEFLGHLPSCSKMDLGLRALNRSEYLLWKQEAVTRGVFPASPPVWRMELERPLHAFSRGLLLQQKSHLQKYNLEKALGITLLHLELSRRIAEGGWTPTDLGLALGIQKRALEPYWTRKDSEGTLEELRRNFETHLEDQGDKLTLAKVRAWFSMFEEKHQKLEERLPVWRKVQMLNAWNASSVLGSLLLQSISVLIVWITVSLYCTRSKIHRDSPPPLFSWSILKILLNISLLASPLYWAFSQSTAGGFYLVSGLAATWLIWGVFMLLVHGGFTLELVHSELTGGTITLLTSLFLLVIVMVMATQYRSQLLDQWMLHGWWL